MNDKLRLNPKLFEFGGIIGRRDFFLNSIYIVSIYMVFILPYMTWFMTKMQTLTEYFDYGKYFFAAPVLLQVWVLLGTAGVCVLFVSNIIKRLNDINGSVNSVINIFCSAISVLAYFSILMPLGYAFLISFAAMIMYFILLFKSGKITSKLPYDFTKEFNWGAFFGTWMWGLFNKSYIPLWYILIFFTPWGFYFQLICGLKGNEWAYKNKKWTDVKKFNKSQENQALFWLIFYFIVIPLVYFVFLFGLIFALISHMNTTIKENPEKAESFISKIEDLTSKYASIYFQSYEINENENAFYILDSDWEGSSFSEKKNLIDLAAGIAAGEKTKKYKKMNPKDFKTFSKNSELPKTKIYSANTNKLLAEFVIDEEIFDKDASFFDAVKAGFNAYRFYNTD